MGKQQFQPSSGAKRIRKFRERKLLSNPEFKIKENERIEKIRKERVLMMTNSQKNKYKEAARERKRKSRLKQKEKLQLENPLVESENCASYSQFHVPLKQTNTISKHPYTSPQTLGKAVKRSMKSLPVSPSKKVAVISGLAKKVGLKLENTMNQSLSYARGGISQDLLDEVRQFYFRSDIVYTMPGLKDEMTVWIDGQKQKLRKYFLTSYLKEVYEVFITMKQEKVISFSKFCELRPKNVLLLKNTPIDQCKCKIHENFCLRLKGLKMNYDHQWWGKYLCDSKNMTSQCWKATCDQCSNGKKFELQVDPAADTEWDEWTIDSETNYMRKITHKGCNGELHEAIIDMWSEFQNHVRIKRIQAAAFENDKKCHRVLQVDFAMSYSCEYQDEIQTALWSRESVQLFTAALFFRGTCKTFLICSNSKDKTKDNVFSFLTTLYDEIMKDVTDNDVKEIIYSDGPSSEFKNKYSGKLLFYLSQKYNKNYTWKYFATGHGKGVVDGIGGRAKSLVRQKVMSKASQKVVQSSQDFAEVVSSAMPATTVIHLTQKEINNVIHKENPWQNTKPIQGIRNMHVMQCSSQENVLKLQHTSDDDKHEILLIDYNLKGNKMDNNVNLHLEVGEWCAITYDDEVYAGEILSVNENEVEVSAMMKSGKYWKWPIDPDILFYPLKSVVKKLSPPSVVCARGPTFSFKEL